MVANIRAIIRFHKLFRSNGNQLDLLAWRGFINGLLTRRLPREMTHLARAYRKLPSSHFRPVEWLIVCEPLMSLTRIKAGLGLTPIKRTVEVSTEIAGIDYPPTIGSPDDVADQVADCRYAVELSLVIAIQPTARVFIAPDTVFGDKLFTTIGILYGNC